jgi:hypothetical protein
MSGAFDEPLSAAQYHHGTVGMVALASAPQSNAWTDYLWKQRLVLIAAFATEAEAGRHSIGEKVWCAVALVSICNLPRVLISRTRLLNV